VHARLGFEDPSAFPRTAAAELTFQTNIDILNQHVIQVQRMLSHEPSLCRWHGRPYKRDLCHHCNAADRRNYMRRRLAQPEKYLLERARRSAEIGGLPFGISLAEILIPESCPALGIAVRLTEDRSPHSPSLDKIIPSRGYVPGNVRVISDRANRLKSDRDLPALRNLAQTGPLSLRLEYALVAAYVSRELLLSEVRAKAARSGWEGREWGKIASFLNGVFAKGLVDPLD
jgi:hypothetical protein